MSVRVTREKYPWRVEIDWPPELRRKKGMSVRFRVMGLGGKLEARLTPIVEWLDTTIGPDNWTPDKGRLEDDHDYMSDFENQCFCLRVKTEEEAALIKMRW